jgi:hypothetical protein
MIRIRIRIGVNRRIRMEFNADPEDYTKKQKRPFIDKTRQIVSTYEHASAIRRAKGSVVDPDSMRIRIQKFK